MVLLSVLTPIYLFKAMPSNASAVFVIPADLNSVSQTSNSYVTPEPDEISMNILRQLWVPETLNLGVLDGEGKKFFLATFSNRLWPILLRKQKRFFRNRVAVTGRANYPAFSVAT